VGQGDAILITTPAGERLLVDGGPSGIELARELGETMPHWARDIDAVFLTHPQQDHLGGLPGLFERFDVEHVYESGAANTTEAYAAYQERAPGRVTLVAGESLSFDGVRIDVLWPPAGYASSSLNNHSLVLRLTYGETTILLTGDIEGSPQRELLATTDVATDVLKVPHHGSATSDPGFLASAAGEIAIISAGEGNPFGHPRDEVLEALAGVPVLRTDLHGRVTVRSDGERVRVTVERR
jgi:competence protein ComEC